MCCVCALALKRGYFFMYGVKRHVVVFKSVVKMLYLKNMSDIQVLVDFLKLKLPELACVHLEVVRRTSGRNSVHKGSASPGFNVYVIRTVVKRCNYPNSSKHTLTILHTIGSIQKWTVNVSETTPYTGPSF